MVSIRKTHYIKQVSHKDIDVLQALRRCGYMNKQQLTQFISASRIKAFCHERVIERCIVQRGKQTIECYRFTDKGQNWCTRNIDVMNGLSYYRSGAPLHDIALADRYLQLTERQRETWKTENELRLQFRQNIEQLQEHDYPRYADIMYKLEQGYISMPDCSYFVDNMEQNFEITTTNYGEAEINAKLEYSVITNTQIEFHRV